MLLVTSRMGLLSVFLLQLWLHEHEGNARITQMQHVSKWNISIALGI